jgi:lipoic acid synthetase
VSNKLNEIPIVVISGHKYQNQNGIVAVKDGVSHKFALSQNKDNEINAVKPAWLKIKLEISPNYEKLKKLVGDFKLNTVCEEARCPNISECWSHGTATIMLMGSVCTRACRFCAVDTGNPRGWLDANEPFNTAKTVKIMKLAYVVLTSVNRDDLADGGAAHYAKTIQEIKILNPETKIEALTPDFAGNLLAVDTLLASGVDVFAQNVETVERLTRPVRDPRAGYWQTIKLLGYAKEKRQDIITKTSIMLGLGEMEIEVIQTMDDLRKFNVDVLTLGQYEVRPVSW